jgi:hypothetical protein
MKYPQLPVTDNHKAKPYCCRLEYYNNLFFFAPLFFFEHVDICVADGMR